MQLLTHIATALVFIGIGMFMQGRVYAPVQHTVPAHETLATEVAETPQALQQKVTTTAPVVTTSEKTNTYTSPFGFSIAYGPEWQTENTTIVLPGGQRISALGVVRYVTVQHCGASGLSEHCRPYLENPGIAFGVLDMKLDDARATYLQSFTDFIEPVTIGSYAGFQYYAGVEGEGVVTVLLPLMENTKTLLIQYTYDTAFDTVSDMQAKGVRTSTEQKQLIDTVLQTLTLQEV